MKAYTKKEWSGIERAKTESINEVLLTSTEVKGAQPKNSSVNLYPNRSVISIETMSEAHRNMRSELSVLSQLNHENIISLVGIMVVPPSILLEYAPMGTMKEVYKSYRQSSQRPLPETCQATIIQVAIATVQLLHIIISIHHIFSCITCVIIIGDEWGAWKLPNFSALP